MNCKELKLIEQQKKTGKAYEKPKESLQEKEVRDLCHLYRVPPAEVSRGLKQGLTWYDIIKRNVDRRDEKKDSFVRQYHLLFDGVDNNHNTEDAKEDDIEDPIQPFCLLMKQK